MRKEKISSNRSFGLVFFLFFLILAIYPILNKGSLNYKLLYISLIFLILGLLNSKILLPLNILWNKFGIFLGKIMSPVIMMIIYFWVVFPTKLILLLLKKDVLNIDFKPMNKKIVSYWNLRKEKIKTMDNQF